jgi:hypothetical protein
MIGKLFPPPGAMLVKTDLRHIDHVVTLVPCKMVKAHPNIVSMLCDHGTAKHLEYW